MAGCISKLSEDDYRAKIFVGASDVNDKSAPLLTLLNASEDGFPEFGF
jgi:hypothetical protein